MFYLVSTDGALIASNHKAACAGVFRDEFGARLGGFS